MCTCDSERIYLYGGFNYGNFEPHMGKVYGELWTYDMVLNRWQLEKCENLPETGASSVLRLWKSHLFLFGGTQYPFGDVMDNTLHYCTLNTDQTVYKWRTITVDRSLPLVEPKRGYGAGVVAYKGYFYVFGGAIGLYDNPLNDLHRIQLHPSSKDNKSLPRWEKVSCEEDESLPLGCYRMELALDTARQW